MPGLIPRLRAAFSPPRPHQVTRTTELAAAMDTARTLARPRTGARRFDAAVVDRLTASWVAAGNAIDQELSGELDRLRNRSRDLFKNNEYAKKFGRMVRNNVVGAEGFALQCRSVGSNGKLDTADNNAIEAAFWRWSRPGNCDITGRQSFVDICRSVALALPRDGEYLVRKVRGGGEFGFCLQVMDVSRLDTTYNRAPKQGQNAIVMGVELDRYRRPVFYHVLTSSAMFGKREREAIPASEILHGFMAIEDEQTRGVPWMHAGMRRVNDLNGYREAAVIAARVGASKMGIWETPDGGPPPGGEESGANDGNFVTDATPGHFDFAPPGYKLHTYDPTYPHDQFDAFCKGALRGIASAWGVSYNSLANDLEGVNFSSIRSGVLEERDEWMVIQNWLITAFLVPIFEEWLEMALLRGAIRLPGGVAVLPASKLSKYLDHQWQGRRWQWVDPKKDIEASIAAIENRLASPQMIAAQTGRDIEEVVDDIARFNELLAAKGVTAPVAKTQQKPAAPDPDDEADD